MRKKIALFLSLAILVMALIPATVFAADDKGMENVLTIVKGRITIPSSYNDFTYSVNTNNGKTTWNFNWAVKNSTQQNPINVTADSNGNITYYSHYVPYDYNKKTLPQITAAAAKTKADSFIKKVYPDINSKIKYAENNQTSVLNYDYSFSYERVENNIPVPENSVNVSVNSNTGDVTNYSCNWTDGLTFPDASKAIPMDAAQNAYKQKLGLKLVYSYNHDINNPKIFLEYIPVYNDSSYVIDAITGEKIQLDGYYYGGMGSYDKKSEGMPANTSAVLTPEEIKAIQEVSKLISQNDAEKIARDFTELNLTSDFKITNANLSKAWDNNYDYSWSLNFSKSSTNPKEVTSVSITIDAVTGEIKNFDRYFPHDGNETAVYDQKASKAITDNFLKTFIPSKYDSLVYDDLAYSREYYLKYGGVAPTQYNFVYYRTVNGVPFIDNPVTVSFDAISGRVTSFYMTWNDDMTFPKTDKVLSLDTVYKNMFSNLGLELQYRFDNSQPDSGKDVKIPVPVDNQVPNVKLVYTVKTDKPNSFDANTGVIIDSSGQPFKVIKPAAYTDIAGNYAEKQINALATSGISLDGTEFKPGSKITQLDFMRLLSKSLDYYSVYSDSSKDADEMYKYLISLGIIKESEKKPTANVTRLDAAKYIVRA
ncbi:MAG: peptidase M4, partial [Bacillota bacterium]|nr:peptidase M4 [Bacillota bacterium]